MIATTTNKPPKNYGAPLPPKAGSKQRRAANNPTGLGRSLINNRNKSRKQVYVNEDGEARYTTDMDPEQKEAAWVKLRSVTQEHALDEFLSTAELANKDFTTERTANIRIINNHTLSGAAGSSNPYLLTPDQHAELMRKQSENAGKVTVPRRPHWTKDMTKDELDRLEKDAFLDWRRQLASLQENNDLLLTPFERNIEVWRQLWRVVDRCHLIVQIVDARNPLLFRSEDLESYVSEIDSRKKNLLLINKADLLTLSQREIWAAYFAKHNIKYLFFSAKNSLDLQEQERERAADREAESASEPESDSESEPVKQRSPTAVVTVEELEQVFLSEAPDVSSSPDGRLQIGLVGYPNVGKSSSINALIGAKKVSVSSTPGKTKHFQTILLSPKVMLCDCPGLVFPNFAMTNGDLVCNGVLPIDQLREFTGPVELVTQRVPKFFLEATYGISIFTKPLDEGGTGVPTSAEFLTAYAKARGYMRAGVGLPDESRAARYILKDYVNAKLLYCHPPPDYTAPDSESCANIMQKTISAGRHFNREVYTLAGLNESRRAQIVAALRADDPDVDISTVDLESKIAGLKFSQHNSENTTTSYAAKTLSLVVNSAGSNLDRDFFLDRQNKDHQYVPFHKKAGPQNSKKHNNKKKLKARQERSAPSTNYGGAFGDIY